MMAYRIGACGALLHPLVNGLQRYVLASAKVRTDDTAMPVLVRVPGNGQARTARM